MRKILKELTLKESKIYGDKIGRRNGKKMMKNIENSILCKEEKPKKFILKKHFFGNYIITNFYRTIEEKQTEEILNLAKAKLDPSYASLGQSILTQYTQTHARDLNLENLDMDSLKEKSKEGMEKMKNVLMFNKLNAKEVDIDELRGQRKQYMKVVLKYFKFYNKSLENLVEGQREVVNNDEFEFEDGDTVKDRLDSLREKLRKVKGN